MNPSTDAVSSSARLANGHSGASDARSTSGMLLHGGAYQLLTAVAVALLGYLVFLIVRSFATALAFAIVMAVVFEPLHARLSRKLKQTSAAALSTVAVVLAIIVPALLIGVQVVSETMDLAGNVRALPFDTILAHAQGHVAPWGLDVESLVREGAQQLAAKAGTMVSRVIRDVWALLVGLAVAILATFFLFRDGARLLETVVRALPMRAKLSRTLIEDLGAMIRSNITASLIAASIQGTIGGLAFAWLHLPAPVLWGVVMGFFGVFPFIGAWLVWGPAATILLIAGRPLDAVLLAAIGLVIVHPIDNILRPAIMARSSKLNGLWVLIGVLGGLQAFGISGLLLGPAVMSVAAALLSVR